MDFNFLDPKEQSGRGKKAPRPSRFTGNILGAIVFFMLITALYLAVSDRQPTTPEIPISELAQNISAGTVRNILVAGDKLTITYRNDEVKISKKESDSSLSQTLANYGVESAALANTQIEIKSESGFMFWLADNFYFLFLVVFLLFFFC